ncbi:MAG TPA: CehA/McbA family metallohydrolase [Gemmatimonadales bacterium]|jgi:dipeptidyl aminopeptidase/acylaminoacyl peptidase|nr:CehA/McbA family metallohydrolase [Gemmatimonadales bacterium]
MYLPQATSGPSSAAWSPDGKELVYSMQGTLWRQRLGGAEAAQLTDGPGYDYQPDWSPDGRTLVYTSYRNDAMELRLLDLRSGQSRALVADGAVNLDPRFSPDGRRVAFVSTAYQGRWHVFVVDLDSTGGEVAGPPLRLTADNDSRLPRYYYSAFDHYLSPAWGPDGKELILVSNRGHVWGSGGLWRMAATPAAPMREIRNEETTWKARPDWSPDGRRVVYSSYLGRQRNQLWLTTAGGGDPFELTYCDCDHTAPRWSPDGRRIAFISNEDGNTSLRVVTVPGGSVETVSARTRRYLHPVGTLRVRVTDPAGRPVAARISVTGPDGRGWAPDGAWRHADDGFDRGERKFEATYFHAAGTAALSVPAGVYTVEVTRGLEYARVVRTVTVAAGTAATVAVRLARLADLPARGWWSGDLHVHMNYGGAYRNDPARLRFQAEAEDLHVVENLIVNKEQRIPDVALFRPGGRPDPVSTAMTIVRHDEEYHTSYWGHTGHLGLTRTLMLPNYAGYTNTAAASLFPDNTTIFDLSHAQGGVSGYVHPYEEIPDPAGPAPLTHALPVDVALGRVDYLEVGGFSDHLATARVWYRLLNAGFRLPAGAGTDAMANFASLHGPVGMNRVFVRAGPLLDYRAWLAALKAGRTFATNGPLLGFTLDGHELGDEIALPAGVHRLTARVWLRSMVPVEKLEIVANGVVVARIPLSTDGTRADATIPLPVTRSGWFTLRAWSSKADPAVLDIYPFATTSPVYVTVAGRPIRSAEDARWFVRWIERLEAGAAAHTGWNTEAENKTVLDHLAEAKAVFLRRAEEAAR